MRQKQNQKYLVYFFNLKQLEGHQKVLNKEEMAWDTPNVKSFDQWLNFGGPSSFPELGAKITLFASLPPFQRMLVPVDKGFPTCKKYTCCQAWRMASPAAMTPTEMNKIS